MREKWGKLTDDDIHVIAGKREQLIGRLQERYGIAKEVAANQADEFVKALTEEADQQDVRVRAGGRRRFFCKVVGPCRICFGSNPGAQDSGIAA